jgi:alginate O-acetyltransferase complex protein AlgI
MVFNTLQFVGFFAVVWIVVAAVLREPVFGALIRFGVRLGLPIESDATEGVRGAAIWSRNAFLLFVSYVFYGAWDWTFLSLIIASSTLDWTLGLLMEDPRWQAQRKRRFLLFLSLAANLGLLGFFKYANFFAESFRALLASVGIETPPFVLEVVLPVGISFYTFQSLGYTIDVYRRAMPAERSFLNFALFVAFFPQLVAGPIERPDHLIAQFKKTTHIRREDFSDGAYLVAAGLFKKVVIADNVALVADRAFGLADPTGLQSLAGTYAFAIQIYCDFSGYTDIARGVSRMMGFSLCDNFNLPYFAENPSDFWRRWHISLSTWLRDYLYISLGGNRGSTAKTYRNLMLTMVIGGLWHGAAWTYVVWGAYHGAILCLHRLVAPFLPRAKNAPPWLASVFRVLRIVLFFHVICVSWVFFRAASLAQAWAFLGSLRSLSWTHAATELARLGPVPLAATLTALLAVVQWAEYRSNDLQVVRRLPVPLRGTVYGLGALLFLFLGVTGESSFIYFQF